MRRHGAQDDDSDSHYHCREHSYSLVALEVFHKGRLLVILLRVKDKLRLSRFKLAALHR